METPSAGFSDTRLVTISQSGNHIKFPARQTGALHYKVTLARAVVEYNNEHNPVRGRKDKSLNPSAPPGGDPCRWGAPQTALAGIKKLHQSCNGNKENSINRCFPV